MISRREFITLLGGAAVAWPLAARGQQPGRPRRIGVLIGGFSEQESEAQERKAVLVAALRELGWIVGRNLHIDYRYVAAGRFSDAQAAELIALAPDVLFATSTPATRALQQATRTIPIVFALVVDPVAADEFRAAGRQHHRLHEFRTQHGRQMAGAAQGSCSRHEQDRFDLQFTYRALSWDGAVDRGGNAVLWY